MKRIATVLLLVIIIAVLLTTAGCGENIPAAAVAPYVVLSDLAGSGCPISTNGYTILDGVLYLDEYWIYDSGCVLDPMYAYYDTPLMFTEWGLRIRKAE